MFAARSTCRFIKIHSYGGVGLKPKPKLLTVHNGRRGLGEGVGVGGIILRRELQQKPNVKPHVPAIRVLWNNLFGKYLLATNVISSGLLMVAGDIAAQEIEYRRGSLNGGRYDIKRMGRMFIVGALMGPMHHYAYKYMDKIMPLANFRNAVWKILIDQLVMSPACILLFFYSACYLERKSVTETNQELIEKFPFIYLMDWILWPGAQYVNFRYLDTKYRVGFVNVCTALYNVFMSYMKHDFNMEHLNFMKFH